MVLKLLSCVHSNSFKADAVHPHNVSLSVKDGRLTADSAALISSVTHLTECKFIPGELRALSHAASYL